MKLCSRCRQRKPKSEFWSDASRADGVAFVCKPCQKERLAERDRSEGRPYACARHGCQRPIHGMGAALGRRFCSARCAGRVRTGDCRANAD